MLHVTGMGIDSVNWNKQVLAVVVTAVMVATVFGVMSSAAATPHDVTTAEYATSDCTAECSNEQRFCAFSCDRCVGLPVYLPEDDAAA